MKPSVQLVYRDGLLTARLEGEIDHHGAGELREALDEAARRLRPLCLRLDFTGVPFMDSSGIGLILGRVRLMEFWKGRVVLCGMNRAILKMVELSGIEDLASVERRAG